MPELLTHMDFPDVHVKHLSQERFFCKRIPYEIKSDVAYRAPSAQEVVFGLGFQDQFGLVHEIIAPRIEFLEQDCAQFNQPTANSSAVSHGAHPPNWMFRLSGACSQGFSGQSFASSATLIANPKVSACFDVLVADRKQPAA
jgi:hypothetical protein